MLNLNTVSNTNMPLSEQRRTQLDSIVQKMAAQNAPKEDVQMIINDFKSKFENETLQPEKTWYEKAKEAKEKIPTIGGFLTGQAKGLASTALSVGQLGSKALESGYNATIGKLTGQQAMGGAQAAEQVKQAIAPKGAAEKVGFATEQIGEFFTPVPGASKVKAAGLVAEKIPSLVRIAEKYPKLISIPKIGGAVAKDAMDAFARTYIQTADEEKAKDAATWTALLGVPFKTYEKIKQAAGKDLAGRVVNSLIKPNKAEFAYGSNPGKAIAEEGITASNFEDLHTAVRSKKDKIGNEIETLLNKPENVGKMDSIDDSLAILDDAIKTAEKAPRTNSAQIKRLRDIKADLLKETIDEAGNITYGRSTKNLPVQEINQLKRDVGEITAYTGNPSDDKAVNKALQDVYSSLKKKVEKIVPEVKKANSRYGNMIAADKAIQNRKMIVERQNLISLPGYMTGGTAAIVTSVLTGGAIFPTLAAGTGIALEKVFSTPIAKTIIGKWLATAKAADLSRLYKMSPRIFQIVTGQNQSQE